MGWVGSGFGARNVGNRGERTCIFCYALAATEMQAYRLIAAIQFFERSGGRVPIAGIARFGKRSFRDL